MEKRMHAEYTKVERSIKALDGEEVDDQPALAYTAEFVSNDEFEGIAVIHGDTAIVAFGEYEEATNRWEFRTDHRDRKEVPFLSLYAGNVVASSEFARRVAETVCAVFDEIG